ncbi:MAG: chemotaxis protein CheW [Treponema sp.]|nr:chemotaxis protein CheW [Treponema sp.]
MATINDKLSILAGTTESSQALTTDQLNEEKRKVAAVDYKMVTFSLSGKDYAIDIMRIKEIAKAGRFTYVPNTLPFVIGVYNLRGDIIPIIDLRLFFNIEVPEREDNTLENMLIITTGDQIFGVVVDVIDKVVGIQKSSIQPPHPLFGDINIKYIYGVVEAEKRLYVLLDVDRIFGMRSPEEERKLAENAMNQMKMRQAAAIAAEQQRESSKAAGGKNKATEKKPAEEPVKNKEENSDLNFVADSLNNFRKFVVSPVNEEWVKNRYKEWSKERGAERTQLQSEADADLFLNTFYSECSSAWWTEEFASKIEKALPDNSAKNIVVWNPGCGKGYESYSLACILKKRYPDAKIRIYSHDVDLLNISNAPLMMISDKAASDWYEPFVTKTVSGDFTFTKEIKDSIMFEYHNCVNANNLPPIDIVFARDLLSFLPEVSQNTLLTEFGEKLKGNGVIFAGANERIQLPGWTLKDSSGVAVYMK